MSFSTRRLSFLRLSLALVMTVFALQCHAGNEWAKALGARASKSADLGEELCAAEHRAAWEAAAASDGLQQPADLMALWRDLWCQGDGATQTDKLKLLRPRIHLPFMLNGTRVPNNRANREGAFTEGESQPTPRSISRLVNAQTLFYRPHHLSLQLDAATQTLSISTSREGGGDDFEARLINGRWMLVSFNDGGAC